MIVLVDYDNLNEIHIRKGLQFIVDSIVSLIDTAHVTGNRITVRLYGGWYEKNKSTVKAQKLEAEIRQNFPTNSILSDNTTSVIVNCELAYSILADPTFHLVYTFRKKGIPSGLKAYSPIKEGCTDTNCPIKVISDFLQNKKCPKCNRVKPDKIFYRGEQKLIDSMITTDLIFNSFNMKENICLVSSDDDFWPGIRASLLLNSNTLIHIHTQNSPSSTFYTKTISSNYIQRQL